MVIYLKLHACEYHKSNNICKIFYNIIDFLYYFCLVAPTRGLYFMLNNTLILPGGSVLISDIGSHLGNRSDPGSTLVCITTNVNTACCRKRDNNGETNDTARAVGQWHYPNGTQVPHPSDGNVVDVVTISYTQQIRLGKAVSDSTPPLGVYTCQVPDPSTGVRFTASFILQYYRK